MKRSNTSQDHWNIGYWVTKDYKWICESELKKLSQMSCFHCLLEESVRERHKIIIIVAIFKFEIMVTEFEKVENQFILLPLYINIIFENIHYTRNVLTLIQFLQKKPDNLITHLLNYEICQPNLGIYNNDSIWLQPITTNTSFSVHGISNEQYVFQI